VSSEPNDLAGRVIAVGETCRLFLAPYPDDFDALERDATAKQVFAGPAGGSCLLDFGRPVSTTAISLVDFVARGALPAEARVQMLTDLFGSRIGRTALQNDPAALAALFEIGGQLAAGRGKAILHKVQDIPESVLILPRATGLTDGDIVVGLCSGTPASAVVIGTGRCLLQPAAGVRLAVLEGDRAFDDGLLMVVTAQGLSKLQLGTIAYLSADELHRRAGRADADIVQILLQNSRTLRPKLLERAAGEQKSTALSDPAWGVHFELDAFHRLANGYFVSGWFSDPEERIVDAVIVDYRLDAPDILEHWHVSEEILHRKDTRALAKRFRAFVPAELKGDAFPSKLRVSLRGGHSVVLAQPATIQETATLRDAILATIEDRTFTATLFDKVYAPALTPLQRVLNARQRIRSEAGFGLRSRRKISFVIPLYGQLGFIRPQLMAFLQDEYLRQNGQIIYCLDDPRLVTETQSLLQGYQAWAKLDIQLLVLDRNGGYAMANNTAATRAEGEHIVLMNSDVIPIHPGWLETALECLHAARPFSVVGPKLLYGDDSLQHAGMYFEKFPHGYFQNLHYWKGYGRTYAPALTVRPVPAVTGACMLLRTADFREVGGFTPDYILGDYEDSDLCLKLRRRGGACIYVPSAELYHFERQSMPKIEDAHDRRSTIYNRALHTARWHDEIAGLMAEFA
jgi:GT2 family glycosyltransferase